MTTSYGGKSGEKHRPRSTPTTPLRGSRSGPLNVGATSGPYHDGNIRDKIFQWQNLSADAIATVDTSAPPDSDNEQKVESSANISNRKRAQTTPRKLRPLSPSKSPARLVNIDSDIRAANTPKKRVVSDEHWMKARPGQDASNIGNTSPNKVDAPKASYEYDIHQRADDAKFDGWVRKKKLKLPEVVERVQVTSNGVVRWQEKVPTTESHAEKVKESKLLDPPKLQTQARPRAKSSSTPIIVKPLLKESASPPKKTTPKPIPTKNIAEHKNALQYLAGRSPPKMAQLQPESGAGSKEPRNPFAALEYIVGRPVVDQVTKPRQPAEAPNEAPNLARLNDSRDDSPTPPVSNPRIEAWLGDTPEKFEKKSHKTPTPKSSEPRSATDDLSKTPVRPRREQLEELRRERRKHRRKEPHVEPNHTQNDDAKESYSSTPHHSDSPSSQTSPTKDGDDSPSTPGLKRRGAKHSRHPPRKKDPIDEPPPRPQSVWSEDFSVHPDDSASVAIPPDYSIRIKPPARHLRKEHLIQHRDILAESAPNERLPIEQRLTPTASKGKENQLSMQLARPALQRNVTTDEDLMSVLSLPDEQGLRLKSACSIRSRKSKKATHGSEEVLADLKIEEEKYARELRTLIDGVIPVLLTTVMSKEKANVAAGLLGSKGGPAKATTPIVSMGIALERLRSIHRRIPTTSINALLTWGEQAERVYGDYIKSWRMGFQHVVVNLVPADGASKNSDDGLKKDQDGFVIGENGERVDVAYLLKRPLVRVKTLSKTFKAIAQNSSATEAQARADKYHDLVEFAKRRQNEEKARLADEAAASVDSTRARDPRTLAPLPGVQIDPTRCVRAMDTFDLNFNHSSGQRLDCRVELIFRDDQPNHGNGGDVLICELDSATKWLLLPPIQLNRISARIDANHGNLIVLLRGTGKGEETWQEVFSLHPDDEQASVEWMAMLGNDPVPPAVQQHHQFLLQDASTTPNQHEPRAASQMSHRRVSPSEIEVPLGEQASVISRQFGARPTPDQSNVEPKDNSTKSVRPKPMPSVASGPSAMQTARPLPTTPNRYHGKREEVSVSTAEPQALPRSLNDALRQAGSEISLPNRLKPGPRSDYSAVNALRGPRNPRGHDESSHRGHARDLPHPPPRRPSPPLSTASSSKTFSVWMPSSEPKMDDGEDDPFLDDMPPMKPPSARRDASLPTYKSSIPDFGRNTRDGGRAQSSEPAIPIASQNSQWSPVMSGGRDGGSSTRDIPRGYQRDERAQPVHTGSRSVPTSPSISSNSHSRKLPSTPPEPVQIAGPRTPQLAPPSSAKSEPRPADASPPTSPTTSGLSHPRHRRTSSPLKHEYAPSTSDESLVPNILDDSYDSSDNESLTSQSSAENDVVPSLPNFSAVHNRRPKAPGTVYEPKNAATLAPSNSASQAAYRGVPHTDSQSNKQIVATIFAWSDRGAWQQLIPDECAVVVSPGLIEAFDMAAYHGALSPSPNPKLPPTSMKPSSPSNPHRPANLTPLLALELTPLVPLRRGTAIDISIRSPPTPTSQLRSKIPSSQLMFRSRTNNECDALYASINHARIHNPTYIALQNARPDGKRTSNWASIMDNRDNSDAGSRSWWKLGRRSGTRGHSSYRAGSSRRTPSVAANTDATESSMAESLGGALNSALKRLTSPGSKAFNVAKSTITGPGDHWSHSSSATFSSANPSGSSTPPAGTGMGAGASPADLNAGIDPAMGTPLGIRNLKIRLYERLSVGNSWRDRGSARLTILQPPRPPGAPPPLAPDGKLIQKKRVVILGKTKGEVLLDVTLGEEGFERVGRVGIAISVWERLDGVEKRGSVMGSRVRTYMVQCRGEAEAGFMFGLVGRAVRY